MGKHSGEAPPRERPSRGRFVLLAAGVTATVVAWGVLVYAAVEFGANARTGDSMQWAFLGLATVGAAACLMLGLVLAQKLVGVLREGSEAALPPPTGGRRAKR